MSAILLVASIIVVVNQYETDKQHEGDTGQISGLKDAVKQANETQQKNAAQFLQGQDSSRQQFLKQFNQLSDKVAKLQTQAATEALQKQAAELQAELHSTEQALNPPKAELQFSFENPDPDTPIRTTSLPRDLQGNITVRFTVMNMTQAVANDGFVSFQICDGCTFVKEPDGFKRVEGERASELNYDFQRILPMQALPVFEAKIRVPPFASFTRVAINYRCKTCVVPPLVEHHLPEIDLGTIYLVASAPKKG